MLKKILLYRHARLDDGTEFFMYKKEINGCISEVYTPYFGTATKKDAVINSLKKSFPLYVVEYMGDTPGFEDIGDDKCLI